MKLSGEQVVRLPQSSCISATVEAADLHRIYHVAVLDEIQMIENTERGSAWTRALLGLQAETIHLCGSAEALELIEKLCERTGDDLEVYVYGANNNKLS